MSSVSNLPSVLNISVRRSDDFSTLVDFSTSAVGSTVSSEMVSAVTGQIVTTLVTSVVDAAAGQINVAIGGEQTAGLAVGTYLWRHVWNQPGDIQRTMLSGFVEIVP